MITDGSRCASPKSSKCCTSGGGGSVSGSATFCGTLAADVAAGAGEAFAGALVAADVLDEPAAVAPVDDCAAAVCAVVLAALVAVDDLAVVCALDVLAGVDGFAGALWAVGAVAVVAGVAFAAGAVCARASFDACAPAVGFGGG